jgi:ParB family chromosome partitioning protein
MTQVIKRKTGLGRGLSALLENADQDNHGIQESNPLGSVSLVALSDIEANPFQPRTEFDETALEELCQSIQVHGVIQPITVRKMGYDKYQLISGERRFRASQMAGLKEIPAYIRVADDQAMLEMALVENIQREDLNPLEEAQGLQRLIKEFGLTHETAAQAVGRSRSAASNLLRLLNLAEPVQTMLMAGDIDMGHARALLGLDKAAQITAANQISAKKMSVREAESLVKKLSAEFSLVQQKPKKEKSRDIKRVEEELSDLLMAEVEVRIKKRVKRHGRFEEMGELSIQFGSLDELNGFIERLRG